MDNSDLTGGAVHPAAVAAVAVLSTVVPNTGPAAGNNTVTLNGSGFIGTTGVTFGASPALTYAVNSASKITAVAPPGTGAVPVVVKNPSGNSNSVTYTYASTPTLSSVSPSQGPVSGGTSVTLTGTGLSGATAVTFGGTPATSFTVVSATQITAVTPAGTDAVPVTVTTAGGTSGPVFFFYVSAPVLSSISPSQGPTTSGVGVTLTGSGFTGATAVTFGGTPAVGFTVVSSTQILATAPAGSGSVLVTVTAPGGTSNSVVYTYLAGPVLTSLTPAQGPTGPGAGVTLTGSGLTTTTAVLFGGAPAGFTVLSDALIAAIAPAGPAGSVSVQVTSGGGTSNSLSYTRVPAPMI